MATSDSAPAGNDPAATADTGDTGAEDVNDDGNGTDDAPEGDDKGKAPTAADELANQLAAAKTEAEKLKAENERILRESRKHEQRSKANAEAAKQLEEIRTKDLPEHEKALEAARKQGRSEAMVEFGERLVVAEFRAATVGRMDDATLDNFLGGLNLRRFVDEDGNALRDDIVSYVSTVVPAPPVEPAKQQQSEEAPAQPPARRSGEDIGQGAGRGAQPEALNGDGLTHAIERAVGIRQ